MESFQFTEFSANKTSFDLKVEDSNDLDDNTETKSTPDFNENIELPLPPGISGDELFESLGYKPEAFKNSKIVQPFSSEIKFKSDSLEDSFSTFNPQLPSSFKIISKNQNSKKNESNFIFNCETKISECLGDNRYSPSKVDSDEENQDVTSKPKVLGKEQAKKRLLAFSIAKQSTNATKKQSKTPVKSKEKPPNPNKGTNFQEQFRATISAIEEEKKKIYQNMPDYLLQEMQELVKGHVVSSPNLKSSNRKNADSKTKDKYYKHSRTSNKSNEHRRSSQRSLSRSSSRTRRRGRRSRSRSRSTGIHNKSRRRSWSRSWRYKSPEKKSREEKPIKMEQSKSAKNEKDFISKKDVFEDWKSYKNSVAETESDSVVLKNEFNEWEGHEIELRNMSPEFQSHYKPIFDYLKKAYHKMMPLRAKVANHKYGKPAIFAEKTIKFTRTKPTIIWTENPSLATDYYMPKEVLLENCPPRADPILSFIIGGKNSELNMEDLEIIPTVSQNWFPREKYLQAISPFSAKKTESPADKSILENQINEVDTQNSQRKISLVNEDYLSDEAEVEAKEEKEITVDGVKVQLDLEMNTVKVRSKWDSDFEDGNNEKESNVHKIQNNKIHCGEESKKLKEGLLDFDVEPLHGSSEEKPQFLGESPGDRNTNSHPGYLASEYEEFLKMVSFDSKDGQTEKINQYDIVKQEKTKKIEKPDLESDQNFKFSVDWDQESEQEEVPKISIAKLENTEKIFKTDRLKKKKNKMEKLKLKKKKIIKKLNKVKENTNKDSCSEDSSNSESESDSYLDSDKCKSSKKKKGKKSYSKRKKFLKEKKKFKKYCLDKNESDLDNGKTKKKRKEKSSDSDESKNKLLKQIDLKKQLIMKKVEKIDTVMEKIDRKKLKENEPGKEFSDKDGSLKPDKKKIKSIKENKFKNIRKTETDSDSISSEESVRKKEEKKEIKKNLFLSGSSDDSEEETKPSKAKWNKNKNTKKEKRKKWNKCSSSSESDESLVSKKFKRKKKEDLNLDKDFKSSLLLKETELKMEERLIKKSRKMLNKREKKTQEEDDDWDTSSSSAELEEELERSWDEEVKEVVKVPEIDTVKQRQVEAVVPEKEGSEKNLVCDEYLNLGTETLKNSLSNFSFNENSFCGFGQELSRDFFLTERSFSNSANIGTLENAGPTPIEVRPFHCIGKGEENKTVDSELYSPGCSDSEMSDSEAKSQNPKRSSPAKEVYDPLNCESEGSVDNNEVEIGTIPLPAVTDISLPDEIKPQNFCMSPIPKINSEVEKTSSKTPPLKFIANEFNLISNVPLNENSPKKQIMNFKNQQMLKTKAASVFHDDSDEENKEPEKSNEKVEYKKTDKEIEEKKNLKKEPRDGSKENERKRSQSRERRERKSPPETMEASRREIRSDSFEIEPLKSISDEVIESVQPIPVLLGVSSNRVWSGSLPGYEFPQVSDNLIDEAESFDIYPSEELKYPNKGYTCDLSVEKPTEKSNKRRKSRSRSLSPKKKRKSKSPVRRRSPKRWSVSPKHRDKSPRSLRRRSPKRKSPSRRRSRSPSRRKKSRRLSSPTLSRTKSPLKRSPKRWGSPLRRKDSPSRGYSPRKDSHYVTYSDHPYWVPSVGHSEKDKNLAVNPLGGCTPQYTNLMSFPRMSAPSISEAEMNNSFYEGEFASEYGMNNYREEISMNNLITVKNHNVEKVESPKRPSLDQRIELELGSPMSSNSLQYSATSQPPQTFEGADPNHYQTYGCDNTSASENFYQNQSISDYNGQYFNEVQPSNYGSYPYLHTHPQPTTVQNTVMQVGNIVEVVPNLQHSLRPPPCQSKTPQIMQVGNVLQVVPTQKVTTPTPVPPPVLDHDSLPSSPAVKTQKATAVVAPSSIVPPPNLEAMINPLIKAILLEREKRNKAKEKRKLERETRRKARQLRREAKLMSVSEKLKKSVQNEGLVLGQEVEDDELLDAMDIPSPPVPVQIITVSSPSGVSPAGKGILITAGFVSKSPSKKKEVKFADGVYPGEGTSSSGEEDIPLSPPKPKLPKEKPFKKKKIKVKKKVKVHIIKQILHEEEDDDDDDNLSPPPPPPGDPPPVFFARFPFAGNAQFPVYQTQTTTTTTVQYPAQAI